MNNETRLQNEKLIRESRFKRQPCPFAKQTGNKFVCTNINARCGERKQFSPVFTPEDETMRSHEHLCMRDPVKNRPGFRALVVNNYESIRALCIEHCKLMGASEYYEAASEKDSEAILERMKREGKTVDLIISDLEIGHKDTGGYELASFVDERNFPSYMILIYGDQDIEYFNTVNSIITGRINKPFLMRDIIPPMEKSLSRAGIEARNN
jgi:hypothetical protein